MLNTTKTDFTFKKIKGRRYTTSNKAWYEEFPGVLTTSHYTQIWVDPIPETPPSVDTETIKVVNLVSMQEDNTTPDKKAWFALNANGDRVKGFIPPIFGQGYTARVFDANNNEIGTTHPVGWLFDYENGVLTFENSPLNYGFTFPIKLKAYYYTGATLDQKLSEFTDEKVKTDSSDPTPGYLSEKIDNNTIVYDSANHVIKAAPQFTSTSSEIDTYLEFTLNKSSNMRVFKNVKWYFHSSSVNGSLVITLPSAIGWDGKYVTIFLTFRDSYGNPSRSFRLMLGGFAFTSGSTPRWAGVFAHAYVSESPFTQAVFGANDSNEPTIVLNPSTQFTSPHVVIDEVIVAVPNEGNLDSVHRGIGNPSNWGLTIGISPALSNTTIIAISQSGSGTSGDGKVLVSSSDETPDYLSAKLTSNSGALTFSTYTISTNNQGYQLSLNTSDSNTIQFSTSSGLSADLKYTQGAATTLSDSISGFKVDVNVDGTSIIVNDSNKLSVKSGVFAPYNHTHVWADINKTNSKLSDIDDVPSYTNNTFLHVNSSGSLEWTSVSATDEKVKADSSDSTPGYLSDKIDTSTFQIDTTNHVLQIKPNTFAPYSHTHTWSQVSKTGSKLSDIADVPSYTNNTFLHVNSSGSLEWTTVNTSDEKVKADSSDSTPGYLSDKIDTSTFQIDTTNHILQIKPNTFAPYSHTHTWSQVSKAGSKLSDIADVPTYSNNKFLHTTNSGALEWKSLTKSDITDFNENDYVHKFNNETISGIKTFSSLTQFSNDIEIYTSTGVNYGTTGKYVIQGLGQTADAKPSMILFAPEYDGNNNLDKYGFVGRIYVNRGSSTALNITEFYDIVCASAHHSTKLFLSGNSHKARLVSTTYNGQTYYGVYFDPTSTKRIIIDGTLFSAPIFIADASSYTVTNVNSDNLYINGSPVAQASDSFKVKATSSDSSPGYLSDKVDNSTIEVYSNKLRVKPGLYAPLHHTHNLTTDINIDGDKSWGNHQITNLGAFCVNCSNPYNNGLITYNSSSFTVSQLGNDSKNIRFILRGKEPAIDFIERTASSNAQWIQLVKHHSNNVLSLRAINSSGNTIFEGISFNPKTGWIGLGIDQPSAPIDLYTRQPDTNLFPAIKINWGSSNTPVNLIGLTKKSQLYLSADEKNKDDGSLIGFRVDQKTVMQFTSGRNTSYVDFKRPRSYVERVTFSLGAGATGTFRVAKSGSSAGSNSGIFLLTWKASGYHGHIYFIISHSFNKKSNTSHKTPRLTILSSECYNSKIPIDFVSIYYKSSDTYATMYLDIKAHNYNTSNSIVYDLQQLFTGRDGWNMYSSPIPATSEQGYEYIDFPVPAYSFGYIGANLQGFKIINDMTIEMTVSEHACVCKDYGWPTSLNSQFNSSFKVDRGATIFTNNDRSSQYDYLLTFGNSHFSGTDAIEGAVGVENYIGHAGIETYMFGRDAVVLGAGGSLNNPNKLAILFKSGQFRADKFRPYSNYLSVDGTSGTTNSIVLYDVNFTKYTLVVKNGIVVSLSSSTS